jgi:hypothetical protein
MKKKYVVTLGPEKTLWLRCETLTEARDVAGFASANHETTSQIWIDCRNGRRRLHETINPA